MTNGMSKAKGLVQEITVAFILVFYVALFTALLYYSWKSTLTNYLGAFVDTEEQLTQLRNVAYAIAGGGLGSITYCMRAFFFYCIKKDFTFDTHKWWYVFRPVVGALLAFALYALVVGGIISISGLPQKETFSSYLTIFAISYLAGFSSQQVVELLRSTSKALFGGSKNEEDK